MKVSGKMINNMERVKRYGVILMKVMKVTFMKVKRMAKASLHGKMILIMKVILLMGYSKDMELITSRVWIRLTMVCSMKEKF